MALLAPALVLLIPLCQVITGVPALSLENDIHSENSSVLLLNSSETLTTTVPTWSNLLSSIPLNSEITRHHRSTPEHILYVTGGGWDYYEDDEDNTIEKATTRPYSDPLSPCPYDRCKHLETECEDIQRMSGGKCLCPGVDGPKIRPDSPRLMEVNSGETGASVGWCAPMSTVHGYRLLYGASDGLLERGPILNNTYRLYTIGNLLPGASYRVCVVAFNEAGESPVNMDENEEEEGMSMPGPCRIFHTASSNGSHIYLGIGVGLAILAGVLGLSVLGYFLWKRKDKKGEMEVNGGEEMGIQNQTFKAESMDCI